ncbi:hypothetical protein Tco_0290679 [Tanacetum coccineum]
MANVPEVSVYGSVAQLTRAIASGSQGVGSHVMVNGFVESGMGNGVNESVFQGIAHGILNGVRVHDVNGIRVSGVNEAIVVNDVRANGSVGVTGGASSVTETVMVDAVRDNDVSGVRINGVNESVAINDVRAMSNDVRTNGGVGVTRASSVSETVMVDAVRGNGVNGVRIDGLNESVMVNDARANGVGGSVSRGMGNGVRTNSGVEVTDGFGSSLGQAPVDHTGQLDRDRLLGWFNQEVVEDLGRLREYHSVARGLKAVVRRRRERIRRLELLRNC